MTVPAGKDFIKLESKVRWQAIIQAPPVMLEPGDIVRVSGAHAVTIAGFTITGPLPDALFCSIATRAGIKVDGGGSTVIVDNHITEIRSANPALRGCQNGIGVRVGRAFEAQIGQATIVGNLIDLYQKGGVVIDNVGSSGFVAGNRVLGIGPTKDIAQNGIQISRGAHAQVVSNEVEDHTYALASPTTDSSTGVLLYQVSGSVEVAYNRATRNDDNFAAQTTTDVTLTANRATNSTAFDGFFFDVDTASNHLRRNVATGNKKFDCEDDSTGPGTGGTANFWSENSGQTENRPGLCRNQGEGGGDD